MTYLETQLETIAQNLASARVFVAAHPALVADTNAFFTGIEHNLGLTLYDAVLAGKVFGKSGWVRKHNRYSQKEGEVVYDWTRTVGSVVLTLSGAEKQTVMNDVPVPPAAFPLMLEDESTSPEYAVGGSPESVSIF